MSWIDELKQGSYRGVEFHTASSAITIGRRCQVNSFPMRDDPYPDDSMGRAVRRYKLDMFVLGTDYMIARNKLIDAIEKAGVGRLMHPWYGAIDVKVDGDVSLEESTADGGYCKISATFVEAGPKQPQVIALTPDKRVALSTKLDVARLAAVSDLARIMSIVGEIATVFDAAVNALNTLASTIREVVNRVQSVVAKLTALVDAIESVADAFETLVNLPSTLGDAIMGMYLEVTGAIASIGDSFDKLMGYAEWLSSTNYQAPTSEPATIDSAAATEPSSIGPLSAETRVSLLAETHQTLADLSDDLRNLALVSGTNTKDVIAANMIALSRFAETAAIVATATGAIDANLTYTNREAALDLRDKLLASIDRVIGVTPDSVAIAAASNAALQAVVDATMLPDDLYQALVDVRAALVDAFDSLIAGAPETQPYTPAVVLPSLVLLQKLYGSDWQRYEGDLLKRNATITHPGFVPPEELQVLSGT